MKILSLSLASLLLGSAAFAQSSSVATNPVGFLSITVKGGTATSPALTLISPTLTNPTAFQSTVSAVSGATITITGASFTTNQYSAVGGSPVYYVEVIHNGSGVLSDISASGTSTVTTTQNISSLIAQGDTVIIRQHVTINQFLGANNTYGLLGSTSGDPSQADGVLVWDGGIQNTYWYYNGTSPSFSDKGWYDLSLNPAGSVTIAPFEGVLIQRKAAGNVTITSTGTVKAGNTLFPITAGANYMGTASAQGLTLATSGLISSGLTGSAGGDPTQSDQVLVYDGSGNLNLYWYYNGTSPSFSDAGWYDLSLNPAGTVALNPGSGVIVDRIHGGAFNWTQPAPTSF